MQNPTLELVLTKWWCKKYNKSPKSDEFQRYTLTELLLEKYEDEFIKEPQEMYKFLREMGAEVMFDSEDPIIAKWEEETVSGKEVDLYEGLSEEEKEFERTLLEKQAKNNPAIQKILEKLG